MEIDETMKEGLLRLERYAQNIPGGFHCCAEDPENGYPFAYISDRFLEILGWEREEFAAKFDNRYTALVHPDDMADGLRYRNAENSATYAQEGDSIFRMLGKNGYRWVSSAANRVEWRGDGYIVGTITDITPYMELQEKLEQQNRAQREALETANHNLLRMMQQMEEQKTQFAQTNARNMEKEERYRQRLNHDALTGTYNRRYYEDVVRNNLGPAGVALMDIDDFKICNDTYGHHAGDMALETVANTIRSCIRETDLLIRYGGDEFLLVLASIPADFFRTKLEQIRDAVQKTVVPGYPHFRLSLSIGGAMQTLADPMENVVRRADLLMYQAKSRKDAVAVDTQGSRPAAQDEVLKEKPAILLVDDAMMNRMVLASILGDDYRILEAENGKQCLELLREKAGQISLVLLDINMPVMDGFEVLRTMNTNHTIEDVPVIMISSDDSEEAILNKPGRLTAEEFAVIKTHSMLGAEMLQKTESFADQPLLQTAYEIARWHHERWDGKGYPDGLKGDDIPISAQLVSMADVYDALTSERCYKKAFPHETAVQLITNGACGAFNPLLIQCLLDVQGELKQDILQW